MARGSGLFFGIDNNEKKWNVFCTLKTRQLNVERVQKLSTRFVYCYRYQAGRKSVFELSYSFFTITLANARRVFFSLDVNNRVKKHRSRGMIIQVGENTR